MLRPRHTFESVVRELVEGLETGTIELRAEPEEEPAARDKRFTLVVEGVDPDALIRTWSDLCQLGEKPSADDFRTVYPMMTTMQGNRFRFRGGDPEITRNNLERLLQRRLGRSALHVRIDQNERTEG